MSRKTKSETKIVRLRKFVNPTKTYRRERQIAEAATVIVDGRPVEFGDVGSHWAAGVEVEVLDPITYEEGPERCGMGSCRVTGGRIGVSYGGCQHISFFRATDAGGSEWRNYGAPHGQHTTLKIKWVMES